MNNNRYLAVKGQSDRADGVRVGEGVYCWRPAASASKRAPPTNWTTFKLRHIDAAIANARSDSLQRRPSGRVEQSEGDSSRQGEARSPCITLGRTPLAISIRLSITGCETRVYGGLAMANFGLEPVHRKAHSPE